MDKKDNRATAPRVVPPAAPPPDHLLQSEMAAQIKVATGQEESRQENQALQQGQVAQLQGDLAHRNATDNLISGCLWYALIGGGVGVALGLFKGPKSKGSSR